jgi:hypothetical protein
VQSPYELISLMELLRVHADAYCRLMCMIGQILARFQIAANAPRHGVMITVQDDVYGELGAALGEMGRHVDRLGLPLSKKHFERMRASIVNTDVALTDQVLIHDLRELITRLTDELESRLFLNVPPSQADFYSQSEPLFGNEVSSRFPNMAEDISEAGKCLGLNRPTACVFHLMRVMESGVQQFGTKLGIQLACEKNWQVVLDGVNKAIKAMNHREPITKAYAEAASHLYNVKVSWRNEVMHPKQTYTYEEARAIFENVKTFMSDLAGII